MARYPEHPAHSVAEGYFLRLAGEHTAAAACFRARLDAGPLPANAWLRLHAESLLALAWAGDLEGARRFCGDALRHGTPATQADLCATLAATVCCREVSTLLPEADIWSQEALKIDPASIHYTAVRGAVLVEAGHLEEGAPMLRRAWDTSSNDADAAIGALYLAQVAGRLGQEGARRRWRSRACLFTNLGRWLAARLEHLDGLAARPAVSPVVR